ncbi:UNVERIFIED_CONTAM: hypothetical protein GTU68_057616, partial [Idotea baltica]|nr:hypothetical protein [Idotea baltica]
KDFDDWQGYDVRVTLETPIDNQKRFRGILAGMENGEVMLNLESGDTIGLQFDWIADAKLVLDDELIKESLKRAPKKAEIDETEFDEIVETQNDTDDQFVKNDNEED